MCTACDEICSATSEGLDALLETAREFPVEGDTPAQRIIRTANYLLDFVADEHDVCDLTLLLATAVSRMLALQDIYGISVT